MKKFIYAILITLLFSSIFISVASAQGEGLTLDLSRDFGSSGFNGEIQGTFSLKASGPATLEHVKFYLDEAVLGEDTESPFGIQFITDNYPTGAHVFSAIGYTTDGKQLKSQTISAVFVSKKEGFADSLKIIVPILVVIFGAKVIAARRGKFKVHNGNKLPISDPRNYAFGGGICPNCKRPFEFQFFSLNLIAGKFTRCPHCGKWSIVKRASIDDLQAAQLAESDTEKAQIPIASDEEKLRKELDNSRYQNP